MEPQKVTLTLTLTLDQVNAVLTGLAKLPYEQSAEIIFNIQKDAQEQISSAGPVKKEIIPD